MTDPRQTARQILATAMAHCPLVAILRGVRPDEVEAVADAIIDAGFSIIEVPLNSPDPFESIARLARRYGPDVLVGAGTVLHPDEVARLAEAGGRLVVSPNVNPAVIAAAHARGMVTLPGFFTPTEAFCAIDAGATGLKLFPADAIDPSHLKAQRAVLPKELPLFAVGGVSPENLGTWLAAGANGAGLGSALYRPGRSPADIAAAARAFVKALGATLHPET